MRSRASDSLLLGLFTALAVGSVALKAAAGPPPDGITDARPGLLEAQIERDLRAQGFATDSQARRERSEMIFARHGDCLLAVRDARGGANFKSVFSSDARSVGPVRYLYDGRAYDEPPSVAFRLGRLRNEVLSRVGFSRSISVPLAIASNAACGGANFGLERTRLPS